MYELKLCMLGVEAILGYSGIAIELARGLSALNLF